MSEANEKPKRSRKKSADIPAEVVAAADKEIGKPPKSQKSPPPKSTRKPKKKGPPKRVDAAAEEVLRQERLAEALDYRRMGYS
ncbi:MAG: hypothetical protein HOO99_10990, partial [Hyphomicrobiaceae bacterium]|nr:hypothetical protein [Hyphomicrobiaceae bacterium]